jgi:hypothetical protein
MRTAAVDACCPDYSSAFLFYLKEPAGHDRRRDEVPPGPARNSLAARLASKRVDGLDADDPPILQ